MSDRKFGWIPDIPDQRDYKFGALKVSRASALPKSVDLRPRFSPVEDQGSLGSCTAQALSGAIELLDKADGGKFVEASRLHIYYFERLREGTVFADAGAMLRDGIKVCAEGYADEKLWPYDIRKFATLPSMKARLDARNRRITEYYRISTLLQFKTAVASGIPVVFGFSVYSSMMSQAVAKSGIVPMPKIGDTLEGGHAVCAAGYDDAKGAALVRNSWGSKWGLGGYFWLPYKFLESRDLSDDIWAVVRRASK